MCQIYRIFILVVFVSIAIYDVTYAENLKLQRSKETPYYPESNGEPILLVGGANIAPACGKYDYRNYIDMWRERGTNYGRIWTVLPWEGTETRYPWRRSGLDVARDKGEKFDLNEWDEEFWRLIRDAVSYARRSGVYLQYMLFDDVGLKKSPHRWGQHPFNPDNNINNLDLPTGIGDAREAYYDLNNEKVRALQEAYVKKAIEELSEFDNIIYEICNETTAPWEWQKYFIDFVDTRTDALIANNPFTFDKNNLEYDKLDIINVHGLYADEVYHWMASRRPQKKILKYDEQFIGKVSRPTLRHIAWSTVIGGGHINWDESGNEAYTLEVTKHLSTFLRNVRPIWDDAKPLKESCVRGQAYVMQIGLRKYIAYSPQGAAFSLALPDGRYRIIWYDPASGRMVNYSASVSGDKPLRLKKPVRDYSFLARLIIWMQENFDFGLDSIEIINDWGVYLEKE